MAVVAGGRMSMCSKTCHSYWACNSEERRMEDIVAERRITDIDEFLASQGSIRVLSNIHPGYSWYTGKYFFFDRDAWKEMTGQSSVSGRHEVVQTGSKDWTGEVIVWDNYWGVHGRRYSGSASGQWATDDVISLKLEGVRVMHVRHPAGSSYDGKYFFFDRNEWKQMTGDPVVTGTHMVKQSGSQSWTGEVVVWDNSSGVHGRRVSGSAIRQWSTDDIITLVE